MTAQRRLHERFALTLPVTVVHEGGEVHGETRNLSLGGMLVATEGPLPFGAAVKVRVTFPALREVAELEATVRWLRDGTVGLQFGSLRAKEVWALNQLFKDAAPLP